MAKLMEFMECIDTAAASGWIWTALYILNLRIILYCISYCDILCLHAGWETPFEICVSVFLVYSYVAMCTHTCMHAYKSYMHDCEETSTYIVTN